MAATARDNPQMRSHSRRLLGIITDSPYRALGFIFDVLNWDWVVIPLRSQTAPDDRWLFLLRMHDGWALTVGHRWELVMCPRRRPGRA